MLDQEPCEDAISRKDIGLIDLEILMCNGDYKEALRMLLEKIEKAPSVQPKTGWIPVSERLPNNDEDVLVCYPQGGMEVCYYHIDDTFYPSEYADLNETGWFNENDDTLYFEPIAWCELSEPYKAESEGD